MNCVEDGALRAVDTVGVELGGSTQVEEVVDDDVSEGVESQGGGAMEPRSVAELCHGEVGGGAVEVVGCSSCPVIGHELLGGEIRVSVGDIVWSLLGVYATLGGV